MADSLRLRDTGAAHDCTPIDGSGVTDGSKGVKALVILDPRVSPEAIDRVARFACSGVTKCKVYVKYVVDMDPIAGLYLHDAHFDKMRKEGRDIVGRQVDMLHDSGVDVEVLPSHFGMAAEEILRVEEQMRPDIIVVAAPQASALRRLLQGDFREDVVRKANAPVLTVKSMGDVRPRYRPEAAVTLHADASVG